MIARLLEWAARTAAARSGRHIYLATACLHSEHAYCGGRYGLAGEKNPHQCKFCAAQCVCRCHRPRRARRPTANPATPT